MPPRRVGRPPLKRTSSGRKSKKETLLTSLSVFTTEEQETKQNAEVVPSLSKEQQEITQFALHRPGAQRAMQAITNPTESRIGTLKLNKINRPGPVWKHLGVVHTVDLPYWFDSQLNDYNVKRFTHTYVVDIRWFGYPGDSPNDLRARSFIVRWADRSPLPPENRGLLEKEKAPLLRWEFGCRGICAITEEAASEESESISQSEGEQEEEISHKVKKKSRWNCPNHVYIVVEVCANDLSLAHVWQRGSHEDAVNLKLLNWSHILRNEVQEAMRLCGARPMHIMKDLVTRFDYPTQQLLQRLDLPVIKITTPFPSWRRPMPQQIRNLLPAAMRRLRLHVDPFQGIKILVTKNPEDIYQPHDFSKPNNISRFTVAVSTDYALEDLLVHGAHDGIGADFSWRNKNENRAAMTLLTVVTEGGRMTPGAALLSPNVKKDTIKAWLKETKKKLMKRAKEIVKDPKSVKHTDPAIKKQIINKAKQMVETGKWLVAKWMIDKCWPFLQAIKEIDPDFLILICQFHIVTALVTFTGDNGRVIGGPPIPHGLKYHLVYLFREFQRVCIPEEVPAYKARFFARLEHACMTGEVVEAPLSEDEFEEWMGIIKKGGGEGGLTALVPDKSTIIDDEGGDEVMSVSSVLTDAGNHAPNPALARWLSYVTDILLPPGVTRDGSYNTNNWTESAWLVFDKTILNMRANKRIDRLLLLIRAYFFPMYEQWPPEAKRIPREIEEMYALAYTLWDLGFVQHREKRVYEVQEASKDGEAVLFVVDLARPKCSPCAQWEQTGKWCVHMRAAIIYENNGSVREWQALETIIQQRKPVDILGHKASKGKGKAQGKSRKVGSQLDRWPSDTVIQHQIERVFKELPPIDILEPNEQSHSSSDESESSESTTVSQEQNVRDGFRSGYIDLGGRPSNLRPLRPWRRVAKRSHELRFNKKPGRKGRQRLDRKRTSIFYREDLLDRKVRMTRKTLTMFKCTSLKAFKEQLKQIIQSPTKSKPAESFKKNPIKERSLSFSDLPEAEELLKLCNPSVASNKPLSPNLSRTRRVPSGSSKAKKNSEAIMSVQEAVYAAEDVVLYSDDLSRWNGSYLLRLEEMQTFAYLLNSLCKKLSKPYYFLISKSGITDGWQAQLAKELKDKTPDQFSSSTHEFYTSHKKNEYSHLFFFDLYNNHWTLVSYYLNVQPIQCVLYNSLETSDKGIDFINQRPIARIAKSITRGEPPNFHANIQRAPSFSGLQKDGHSCGFWAILTALCKIFTISIKDSEGIKQLSLSELKDRLGSLWISFIASKDGLPKEILGEFISLLEEDDMKFWGIALGNYPDIIATRPSWMGQYQAEQPLSDTIQTSATKGMISRDLQITSKAMNISCSFSSFDYPWQILEDPNADSIYAHLVASSDLNICVSSCFITHNDLPRLIKPTEWLNDEIVNAYLGLCQQYRSSPRCYIMNSLNVAKMIGQPLIQPLRPPGRNRKFWVPRNVKFRDLSLLILPWNTGNHWICIAVFLRECGIRIYDSLARHINNQHEEILERVQYFLENDITWRGIDFSDMWSENRKTYVEKRLLDCPQQGNNYDCGLYMLIFAWKILAGREPSQSNLGAVFNQQRALDFRRSIAVCFGYHSSNICEDLSITASIFTIAIEESKKELKSRPQPGSTPIPLDQDILGSWSLMPLGEKKSRIWYPVQVIELDIANSSVTLSLPSEVMSSPKESPSTHTFRMPLHEYKPHYIPATKPSLLAYLRWPAVMYEGHFLDWDDGRPLTETELQKLSPKNATFASLLQRKGTIGAIVTVLILGMEKDYGLRFHEVMKKWNKACDDLKNHKPLGEIAFIFQDRFFRLLQLETRYLIRKIVATDLLQALKEKVKANSSGWLDGRWEIATIHGPGAALMACYVYGADLGVPTEEAASLFLKNRIHRSPLLQEMAWTTILTAAMPYLTVEKITEFTHKHQISDSTLGIPKLLISPIAEEQLVPAIAAQQAEDTTQDIPSTIDTTVDYESLTVYSLSPAP
ncbi:hypothetical protein M422DRAFT_253479 [Sphaerobolus stellatus SS14]|uniref:Ubiquitin-like protease family profile domain-containing protein n=1 Tax=Sphaerobolus stellatus (strain SS14) TaxID=990650 RepID=A0A0C9VWR2_SPHS4|nr:hypothetical protein M422DRAFT_253479 [Sphaerobolus stellatus SS14]